MTRWFWIDGRFAWPFVAVIVFLTVSLIAADYAWRILVMPIDTLFLYAVAVDAAAALAFIVLWISLRRH